MIRIWIRGNGNFECNENCCNHLECI